MARRRIPVAVGQRFARLTIVGEVDPYVDLTGKAYRCFAIRCDCGREATVRLGNLLSGNTTSCGRHHPRWVAGAWKHGAVA